MPERCPRRNSSAEDREAGPRPSERKRVRVVAESRLLGIDFRGGPPAGGSAAARLRTSRPFRKIKTVPFLGRF